MALKKNSWEEANIVTLLQLDQRLSPTEIDDTLTELTLELWYRVLQDGIDPLLTDTDRQLIQDEFKNTENPLEIIQWIQSHKPTVQIEPILAKQSCLLKKEFVQSYIEDLQETLIEDSKKIVQPHITRLLLEIDKKKPNFTLIQKENEYITNSIYSKKT